MMRFRTSLSEFRVGERVEVGTETVAGEFQLRAGTVTRVDVLTVALDGGEVAYPRPYQCRGCAAADVGQLELFGALS